MLGVLSVLLILIVIFEYSRNRNRGVFLYLLLAIFAPYITLGSLTFRSELIAAPVLLVITLIQRRWDTTLTLPFFIWVFFVIYCLAVSLLSNVESYNSTVNYIAIFNYARFAGLILIGSNLNLSDTALVNWNKYLFLASIPIFFLSLGVIFQNSIASWITKNFFTSPTRTVYETQLLSLDFGYAFRSIGVFENVSYYATFILIVMAIGVSFLLRPERSPVKKNWVIYTLLFNLLAGVSTFSMTFYIGFTFITLYYFVKRPLHAIKGLSVFSVLMILFVITFWERVKESFTMYLDVFNYLTTSFMAGDKLTERYLLSNRDTGDLTLIFKDSWFFGNGFRYYDDFIVNDSLYLEFFYQGGFIGSIIIISFIVSIFYYSFKSKLVREHKVYLMFGMLFLAGVGCNSLAIVRMSEWIWPLIGIISVRLVPKYYGRLQPTF